MIKGVCLGGSLFGIAGAAALGGSLFGITGAVQMWSEGFDWEDDCLVALGLFKCDQRDLRGWITVWYHLDCSDMISEVWPGGSLFCITLTDQIKSEVFDWEDSCLVSPWLFKCDQRYLTGRITVWYHLDCSDVISGVWSGGSLFCITLTDQIKIEVIDWENCCLVSPWLFKCDQRYLTGRITVWYHLDCSNVIRGIWKGGSLFGLTGAVLIWSERFDWEDHCLVSPWLFKCDQRYLKGRITVWYHQGCSDVIRGIWQSGSLFGVT